MVKVSLQLSILHCVARGGEIEVGQNYIELLTLINYLQVFRMAMHVFRFSTPSNITLEEVKALADARLRGC